MAKTAAVELAGANGKPKVPVIGVFATSDPRIDEASRKRCQNIVKMTADTISGKVVLPDKKPVPVVYSTTLVDGEKQADIVAEQFRKANGSIFLSICKPSRYQYWTSTNQYSNVGFLCPR